MLAVEVGRKAAEESIEEESPERCGRRGTVNEGHKGAVVMERSCMGQFGI